MPPFPDVVPPAASQSAFQQPASAHPQEPAAPAFPIEPHMNDLHANDSHPSEPSQPFGANHSFGAEAFAATAVQQAEASTNESFLAAARRSARDAAASSESTISPGMFAWAQRSTASSDSDDKSNIARYVLIGGLVLLVFVAVVAGKMLSGMFGGHQAIVTPTNISKLVKPTSPANGASNAAKKTAATNNNNLASPALHAPLADNKPAATVDVAKQAQDQSAQKPMGATYPIISTQAPVQTPPQPVVQTKAKPLERLTTLAKAGSVTAEAVLGFDYLDGGNGVQVNEAESARWLERAANQGNAVAAYRLGTLYERGHGVPTDSAKAMQWYTVAAKLGNRKAMHNLAVAFAEGTGVPKNMAFAVQWFTRAANLGLSDSQFNLAVLYERGMGVPQSLTEAYKWYTIAAAQGDAESKTRVDALATQLTPVDKQTAQRAADAFRPKKLDKATNNPPTSADIIGD
jgi:localization factor PodJL